MISLICETMRGIRPSVGSSSRMILGSSIMARAMASICCSPPDSVPPAWLRRSPSRGKKAKTLSSSSLLARVRHAGAIEAGAQVLHHRQKLEDAPVLGDIADADARELVRRLAR